MYFLNLLEKYFCNINEREKHYLKLPNGTVLEDLSKNRIIYEALLFMFKDENQGRFT